MAAKTINLSEIFYTRSSDGARIPLSNVLDDTAIFAKNGMVIIKHEAVRKLADSEGIQRIDIKSLCTPNEKNYQKHWVAVTILGKDDRTTTMTGEADQLSTGDFVGGVRKDVGISAQYRGAMAEKRAFDRAVLAHVQCYGIYSEVEADFESKKETPLNAPISNSMNTTSIQMSDSPTVLPAGMKLTQGY